MSDREADWAYADHAGPEFLDASMEPGPCQTGKIQLLEVVRVMVRSLQWSPVHVRPGRGPRRHGVVRTFVGFNGARSMSDREATISVPLTNADVAALQWSPVHVRPGRSPLDRGECFRDFGASMEPGPCQTGKASLRGRNASLLAVCFNGARSMSDREAPARMLTKRPRGACFNGARSMSDREVDMEFFADDDRPALELQWSPVHVRPGSLGPARQAARARRAASMEPGPCQTGKCSRIHSAAGNRSRFNGARSMSDREDARGNPPRNILGLASMEPGPCQTGKPTTTSPGSRELSWSRFNGARSMSDREAEGRGHCVSRAADRFNGARSMSDREGSTCRTCASTRSSFNGARSMSDREGPGG